MLERVLPRALLLLGAGLSLLTGLIGGLGLMDITRLIAAAEKYHGPLMVFGFVGTAITLERAIALRRKWALLGPLSLIIGSIIAVLSGLHYYSATLWSLGFVFLCAIYYHIYRRQPTLTLIIQTAGAIAAIIAALRWLSTQDFHHSLIAAAIFVVLTVIGERIELARLQFPTGPEQKVTALSLFILCAGVIAIVEEDLGSRSVGLGFLILTIYMARRDVARNLIRSTALPRYSAVLMLLAYFWLGVGAIAWIVLGNQTEGYRYDIIIHTMFLGFTMSMIFAHAPIIFTSVLKQSQVYSPVLYFPVIIMQLGLICRVAIGDVLEHQSIWQLGGVLNVLALVAFMLIMVTLLGSGRRRHAT